MNRILILSGPSGAGKTSIAHSLTAKPGYTRIVSYTTRAPRQNEKHGVDYHYISREQFNNMNFLESAEVSGNLYGTPYIHDSNYTSIMTIDPQGAQQIYQKYLANTLMIFISASAETLNQRLINRDTDSQATIHKRMNEYDSFMKESHRYQYHLINDSLDETVAKIDQIANAYFYK